MPRLTTALLLLLMALTSSARAIPQIKTPVVDLGGYLSHPQKEQIANALIALRNKTGIQMAVLLVDTTGGVPIDDYATTVFNKEWKGGSAERNDGLLFVIAVDDRRMRIELGTGLEAIMPDWYAARTLESAKDAMRDNRYDAAVLGVIAGVAKFTDHVEPQAALTPPPTPFGLAPLHYVLIFAVAWALGVLYRLLAPKKPRLAKSASWLKTLHALPQVPDKVRNLTVWAIAPALLSLLLLVTGSGALIFDYLLSWYVIAATGLLSASIYLRGPVRSAIYTIMLVALAALMVSGAEPEPFLDEGLVVIYIAISVAVLVVLATVFCMIDTVQTSGGGMGGGRVSWSSRGSAWGSSSRSSSRPSSSSSSWSGGGGRSGGGGASASW